MKKELLVLSAVAIALLVAAPASAKEFVERPTREVKEVKEVVEKFVAEKPTKEQNEKPERPSISHELWESAKTRASEGWTWGLGGAVAGAPGGWAGVGMGALGGFAAGAIDSARREVGGDGGGGTKASTADKVDRY